MTAHCIHCGHSVHETIPGSGVFLHTATGSIQCEARPHQPVTTAQPNVTSSLRAAS